ncbi:16921_t:CDS:2 [Funneliformis mosseae]|uniref:16921_t:CDS:1 n=1 Tax=Funneliformis mosseae TaxID=27381 RepID=A0A9N9C0Q8_FUNMO|nr:16921_t:CDS:2 [Funneliformis mosseae]
MKYNDYKENMQLKITKLEETIVQLESGENMDDDLTTKSIADSDNVHSEAKLNYEQQQSDTNVIIETSSVKWI